MKLSFCCLFLTFGLITMAQEQPKYPFVAEQMPRYYDKECEALPTIEEKQKCAEKKMLETIYKNLKYPPYNCCIEGIVIIRFEINEKGEAINHRMIKDIGCYTGEEGIRVTKLLKQWIPAEENGKKITVSFNMPIRFRLH